MTEALRSGMGTGHQSQHTENGYNGRGTIADQRQGQADNGHDTNAHAHIDQDLEHQSRGGTEADQAAHVVGAFCANVNAAGNDGQLQNHDQNTAEEAHLLTDGGEDVVRVLGEQVAALGTVAVEQALAHQTAAGEGLEVDLGVIPGADTLGIEGGVNEDQNTFLLIVAQELPQNWQQGSHAADCNGKPPEADTTGKSHANEDEHKDQGNAHVGRQYHVQAEQQSQMEHHVHDRGDGGDIVLVGSHDRGHDQDIGDLTDLCRLDVEGQQGEVQPASVTGVVVGAEGDQKQQQENVESYHQISVFLQKFHIDGRKYGVNGDTDKDGQQLNHDVTQIAVEFFGGCGAGNNDNTKARGDQAEDQQNHIAFFKEILQFFEK